MGAIRLERLAQHLGEREVLRAITLHVRPGEVLGMSGPNGAGKTTLLRVIAGLLLPTSGVVRVLGQTPDHARRSGCIGWCGSGDGSWSRRLSLRAGLAFHARAGGLGGRASATRIHGLAERLGFSSHLDVPADRCSAGIRQRATLGRALLLRPLVLLLDEPLRGIDTASQAEILGRLRPELEGRTVIWVSHSLEELRAVSDRQVELRGGCLREAPRLWSAA
ncbi:MAG TPA: ATP-binding cassette domain-containing protein [Myxococcota bacterium]|nr:ATP-binding cassette domain-containing protein [Myxococcota bacterium]